MDYIHGKLLLLSHHYALLEAKIVKGPSSEVWPHPGQKRFRGRGARMTRKGQKSSGSI